MTGRSHRVFCPFLCLAIYDYVAYHVDGCGDNPGYGVGNVEALKGVVLLENGENPKNS